MSPSLTLAGKRVLLIVAGGIAAFKALELVRLLRREGVTVRCVLTEGGAQFVTLSRCRRCPRSASTPISSR